MNNFTKIKELLKFDDPDKFYFIQILKRRKDNPTMGKDMCNIDNFCVYSLQDFERYESRIIEICERNNARAYIRLNRRSDKKIALQMLARMAQMIASEQYNTRKLYYSIAGEFHSEENKTWIVDIDTLDFQVVTRITNLITMLQPTGSKVEAIIPTVNGFHMITRPFNLSEFRKYMGLQGDTPDIHKDNPTLLYFQETKENALI
jgi:hypothetical protein